jgi:hypothetical protein
MSFQDYLKYRFLTFNKVAFISAKAQKVNLHRMGTTQIIAFPTLPKSHFGLGGWQKMNKQHQATK